MLQLEKYDGQKYVPNNTKCKTTTGYTGMGCRLTAYKRELAKILQNGNAPKNQPLMDRDVALKMKPLTITDAYGQGGTHTTLTEESVTRQNDN